MIKIGLVAPFEGRYRSIGYDAIYAARLAVREINAAGGVNGWQLELVAYDDRADLEMARAAARNLLTDPDVVAVIGHYRQETTAAAGEFYMAGEMPLIALGGWLTNTTGVWHLSPSPETLAARMLTAAPVITPATAALWGDGPLAAALAAQMPAQGYRRIADGDGLPWPDVVFSTLPPADAAERLAAPRAQGWAGILVGDGDLLSPTFTAIAGDAAQAVYAVTPYPQPSTLPQLEAWTAAYRAVGPHVPDPGPYALPTYEAVYVLSEALATATQFGLPTRSSVMMALSGVRRVGMLGTVTWDMESSFWQDAPVYVYAP
ncbi:MAG TPA: ABC transporter substrate-binding protein [Anaerolineae bacterium]|nr:ABC transporter substrate-binding protein [Anaerolineae bacterium]